MKLSIISALALIPITAIVFQMWDHNILEGYGFSKEVRAEEGELLRLTLSPDEKFRIYRPLKEISPELQKAVILLEDRYFHWHWGFNPVSLGRAVLSLSQDRKIGGSTITMQMVRLKHKIYTRTIWGKLQQIVYAFGYEIYYSKNQILEAYLNLTPYGSNIEGVESASRLYFGKTSHDLNLLEALTLAVIPQNPLKRSLNQEDLKVVDQARERLLKVWIEENPQDQKLAQELQLPVISNRMKDRPFRAPHFVERVMSRYPRDSRLQTTLNLELQAKIEAKLKNYLQSLRIKGIHNGAVLLIEGPTREIKAWVGSGDYFDNQIQGQIDGIMVARSPGSTLKPFVFGQAMDEGIIHPSTLLKDTPASFGTFDPENFDRRYLGPISATQALILSRNVPAIYLESQLKQRSTFDLLKAIQVQNLKTPKTYGLGIAIGTAEMTPLDLGGLYTALYNLGEWAPLKWTQIEKEEKPTSILSPESSYLVLDMLTKSYRDQNSVLDDHMKMQFPMAWKTGTSYGFRDAWTVGVFGPYVLVVWLGNFDFTDNPHLIGRDVAAPLFFQIAESFPRKVLEDTTQWRRPFGLNLKKVEVCSVSGHLPGEHCHHKKPEWFIPSVSPIETCSLHRELMISQNTGLRLCGQPDVAFRREVFEFWSSDLLEIFHRFGVRRKVPPAFDSSCRQETVKEGLSPEMVSPKKDLRYVISYSKSKLSERIPLRAITDADVKELTWFADQRLVGKATADETLFFDAQPGVHEIVVVDDQGRSASRKVEVSVSR